VRFNYSILRYLLSVISALIKNERLKLTERDFMMINKIVALPILMAAMSLVGCNDSKSGGSSEKSKIESTASGRLLVSSADSAELAVVDLKKGAELDRISLNNIASSLYSSPKYRFGLVADR
jgi:hypothetical protein